MHSYTHFNSQIGFRIQISFELRIAVCVWVYVFLVYECMGVGWVGGYPMPPPTKSRFLTPLQNTRWKWLLGAVLSHFWGPGAQGPFSAFFRVLFHPKLVYRSVCIHFFGQGGQTHTSIHTLGKHNSAICTFSRYLPGKNTTISEIRPFLKRHGTVSVWVYVYFPR